MNLQTQLIPSRDGFKIWAQAVGDLTKPAVVFIHGFGCSSSIFEKQFASADMLRDLYMVSTNSRQISNKVALMAGHRSDTMLGVMDGAISLLKLSRTNQSIMLRISKLFVMHSVFSSHLQQAGKFLTKILSRCANIWHLGA